MKLPLIKNKPEKDEEPSRMQILLKKLSQNTLIEFKIGFESNEFQSKRDIQNLMSIVCDQYLHKLSMDKFSSLESIRIGWKLPRFAVGPILQQVLPLLLHQPARVRHLQLVMNVSIPLPVMQTLVSWHTLDTLDLRSLRIQTKPLSERTTSNSRGAMARHDRVSLRSPVHASVRSTYDTDDDSSILGGNDSILAIIPFLSDSITSLKLVDCNLNPNDMPVMIEKLRRKRHIRSLSLRHNRRLHLNGWERDIIQKLPFLKSLDLSLCDLDVMDGFALARALEQRKDFSSEMTSLSIAGNYRIPLAIPKIVEVCAKNGVIELECSFCDIQNKMQKEVFECLATVQPCSLRSLKMQSVRIKDYGPLIQCVQQNESLERLILDHPREPYQISSRAMSRIKEVIPYNYHLHTMRIDTQWDQDPEVLQDIEYWLALNRCGRSIVVHDGTKSWSKVLGNAAAMGDFDIMYWMLRNGAELF